MRVVIACEQKRLSEWIETLSNDTIMANDLSLLADNCYERHYIEPVTLYDEDVNIRSMIPAKIRQERDILFQNIDGLYFNVLTLWAQPNMRITNPNCSLNYKNNLMMLRR
jgi:hypothetical protein